jgi:hypothetical protein
MYSKILLITRQCKRAERLQWFEEIGNGVDSRYKPKAGEKREGLVAGSLVERQPKKYFQEWKSSFEFIVSRGRPPRHRQKHREITTG